MDSYNSTANFHIAVIKDKSLSYLDKIVYIVLCSHADNEARECSPKIAIIAEEASCSPRTVHKSLNNLEKHGVVSRKRRFVDHRQISSLYKIIGGNPEQNFADENVGNSTCSDTPNNMQSDTPNNMQSLNTLRIFNNSLKGEACLPASAEKESSLGNPEEHTSPEETKNSLTGESLLPSSQLCEEQEKPQTAENTQDNTTENPVIKAECTETHIAEEMGACLPAQAENNAPPSIPEEKPLTQDEKLRRYYELRRKCEEEHRKAEAEACLPTPAEKEATPEEPKAPQTEGSTLPDYLIQQYEQMRKMSEEMMKPTKEPRYVSCDVADVVADIKNHRVINAESEKAIQTPVAKSELADKTLVAKTEPIVANSSPMASGERVEHRDTPVAKTEPMYASTPPDVRDRHIAKTDNLPEPAEASEPSVPKETDKSAETSNNPATDKGKYSGGGSSKDVYPVDYAPDIMRPTAEYFLFKTGRKGLRWEEVSVLRTLSATQYPTRVNKEIERACERFKKRNQSLLCLTLMYIEAALKNQPTWGNKAKQKKREAKPSPELEQYPIERYTQSAEAVKAARAARLKGVETRFDPDKAKRRSSNE